MKNIFLVGFMGVGKTTIGKKLTVALNSQYVDVDDEFARLHDGVTTGQYIREHGLAAFRPEEQATLKHIIATYSGAVVATGAGLSVYPGNMEMMLENGITVHIRVPLAALSTRMTPSELAKRPVWQAQTPEGLQALFEERQPIYDRAEYSIDGTQSVEDCVKAIVELIRN